MRRPRPIHHLMGVGPVSHFGSSATTGPAMPQRTDQHPLDRAAFGPRAVAVAEIDREKQSPR